MVGFVVNFLLRQLHHKAFWIFSKWQKGIWNTLKTQIFNFELSFEIFTLILLESYFFQELLRSLIRAGFWNYFTFQITKILIICFICFVYWFVLIYILFVSHFLILVFFLSAKALYKNKSAVHY